MGNITDSHGAGAAFAAVATNFGARQAQFVAQRIRQCFLWHNINTAGTAIDVQGNEALNGTCLPGLSRREVKPGTG